MTVASTSLGPACRTLRRWESVRYSFWASVRPSACDRSCELKSMSPAICSIVSSSARAAARSSAGSRQSSHVSSVPFAFMSLNASSWPSTSSVRSSTALSLP
ncbi:Uncharacterised protein [Mycobacteroides abscessus]|nr:Uncharacterised protein [Mycobacteroides abscessus]